MHSHAGPPFRETQFSVSERKAQSSPASLSFPSDRLIRGLAGCISRFWATRIPIAMLAIVVFAISISDFCHQQTGSMHAPGPRNFAAGQFLGSFSFSSDRFKRGLARVAFQVSELQVFPLPCWSSQFLPYIFCNRYCIRIDDSISRCPCGIEPSRPTFSHACLKFSAETIAYTLSSLLAPPPTLFARWDSITLPVSMRDLHRAKRS